jgi:fructokinase
MISVIGENVVDLFAQADGRFMAKMGGSPFNFAIAAARQLVPVQYLSPISTDAFGNQFAELLRAHNIQFAEGSRSKSPSSLAFVTVDELGQPHYSLYRQGIADRDISIELLLSALSVNTTILHTGSLALEPQDAAVLLPVLKAAKARGIKISVDINVRLQFVSDSRQYRDHIHQVVALSDYIKASDEDLAALYPEEPAGLAFQRFLALAPNALVAYTRGELGAQLWLHGHYIEQAIIPPSQFVDTVGAGDTFFSNLLCGLIELPDFAMTDADCSLTQLVPLLKRATLAASINVSRQGCQPPSKTELDTAFAALA